MQVAAFDPSSRTIRTKDPSLYGVYSSTDQSNDILRNSKGLRGFYVYNLLEELDQPGEWFLDQSSGILYVWPSDNSITTADIEASVLRGPILTATNTSNLTIKGIDFAYGRTYGISLERTTGTIISNCVFNGLGMVGITTTGQDSKPKGNTGLFIHACTVEHTGTGGIILDGGDRNTLTPGGNSVDNCSFLDYSRRNMTFSPAIWLTGVGNQVTHAISTTRPTRPSCSTATT
ncbi:right-handed parallel beta-helix repeat-containing protein [Puia sp. P3]|uniref:right-handed parallel beta-helix repeat-containing protein n=1 Tax=Puia sp. P3 TaxID=3423952 RepID=UPI003D670B57